jgi:DNA polymerase-3 subunit epsilon
VIDRWETLVNPEKEIPAAIFALTGITNEMVSDAPIFIISDKVFELLSDRIFVHNVNFDYSFVRHELERAGLKWTAKNMYRKSCKKNKTWNGLLQFRKALPIFGHRFR